ncbi:MAG: ABC transporter permease [Oscillospiraceae bacterium]|jgi:spermidine/putrescine transport system permease protein|nr:ABC transporter permease [Oscillospiraceae bacterium]
MRAKAMLLPFLLWLALFILVPLGLVVYYGVTVEEPIPYEEIMRADGSVHYRLADGTLRESEPYETRTRFSLANVSRFFDPMYVKLMGRSFYVAFCTTLICLLLGYPVALILTGKGFRHRNLLLLLIILPMWMNFLLRTYAWLSLLENSGLVNHLLEAMGFAKQQFLYHENAVVLGMVYNFLPFMVLPLYTVMEKIDHSQLEAAADLGANPFQRFLRILLPFSLPGVLEGITMVFVPAVTTFVISQLMGGGKVPLIGDIIQQQFGKANDWHFGATMSLLVMVVVLAFMYALNRADTENAGKGEVRIW